MPTGIRRDYRRLMGRDVSVYCRCWEDGLTSEPPVPREYIEPVDRSDPYRQAPRLLDDDAVTREMKLAFHAWMQRPCAHERMDVLTERVWKWSGTDVYSRVVHGLGNSWFPRLAAIEYGYGDEERPLPAAEAREVLAELDLLCEYARENDLGELTEMVDVVSGERWWHRLDGYDTLVYQAPPWGIGMDADGLFLWDIKAPGAKKHRDELFRATRFSVRLGPPVGDRSREHEHRFQHPTGGPCDCVEVTFTDLDTGVRFVVPMTHGGEPFLREVYHRRMSDRPDLFDPDAHFLRVWTRPVLLTDFADVVTSLRRVFQAAVDADTAVVWW
jgi:hypothetical protein